MCLRSSSVSCIPSDLITVCSSFDVIEPSPSLSNRLNASLYSTKQFNNNLIKVLLEQSVAAFGNISTVRGPTHDKMLISEFCSILVYSVTSQIYLLTTRNQAVPDSANEISSEDLISNFCSVCIPS